MHQRDLTAADYLGMVFAGQHNVADEPKQLRCMLQVGCLCPQQEIQGQLRQLSNPGQVGHPPHGARANALAKVQPGFALAQPFLVGAL